MLAAAGFLLLLLACCTSAAPVSSLQQPPSFADVCSLVRLEDRPLDKTSRSHCKYILSRTDLAPFLLQWGSPAAAAQDLYSVLQERLLAERGERRKRDLLEEVCETLTGANSTTNILSDNEVAGIAYEGDGLLDGIALSTNPSILSGIFQTATSTQGAVLKASATVTGSTARAATPSSVHRVPYASLVSSLSAASLASARSAAAAEAATPTTAPLLGVAIQGQGLLDGVDLTLEPALLGGVTNLPSVVSDLLPPVQTASASEAGAAGGCEAA
ncbi:hypothetical protein JCM10450v2_007147 [Rhodotorula kratochvilovae]